MAKDTISTFQLFERFPDKESARVYFESRPIYLGGSFFKRRMRPTRK